jgi:hypothetical protein
MPMPSSPEQVWDRVIRNSPAQRRCPLEGGVPPWNFRLQTCDFGNRSTESRATARWVLRQEGLFSGVCEAFRAVPCPCGVRFGITLPDAFVSLRREGTFL